MCKFWSFGGVFPSPNSDWLVINKQLYDIFFHVSLPQNSRTMQRSVLKKSKVIVNRIWQFCVRNVDVVGFSIFLQYVID